MKMKSLLLVFLGINGQYNHIIKLNTKSVILIIIMAEMAFFTSLATSNEGDANGL